MTYIGNPQGTGFSKIDSQQFSGTGSATAFTMRHPVGQPEHVEVYVNNVRQDPHSAYTVSGTTLTFTEAPASGDVIDARLYDVDLKTPRCSPIC